MEEGLLPGFIEIYIRKDLAGYSVARSGRRRAKATEMQDLK